MSSHAAARRRWAREEIARLDPVADHERLTHLSAEVRYGDPVLTSALYTVAFSRQMAVPSIAAVVHRGGRSPIIRTTRRRNDETLHFFGQFMRHGHSSPEGRAWIERLNAIHARFPITNDQSLYTLASLAFEAERIPARFGLDPLSTAEKEANYRFWRGVGGRMGLHGIPGTHAAFRDWTLAYERAQYGFTPGGRAVVEAMLDDFAARWFPTALRRPGRELVLSAFDPELRATLRLRPPRRWIHHTTGRLLRAYFAARTRLPDPADRSWADFYAPPQ